MESSQVGTCLLRNNPARTSSADRTPTASRGCNHRLYILEVGCEGIGGGVRALMIQLPEPGGATGSAPPPREVDQSGPDPPPWLTVTTLICVYYTSPDDVMYFNSKDHGTTGK